MYLATFLTGSARPFRRFLAGTNYWSSKSTLKRSLADPSLTSIVVKTGIIAKTGAEEKIRTERRTDTRAEADETLAENAGDEAGPDPRSDRGDVQGIGGSEMTEAGMREEGLYRQFLPPGGCHTDTTCVWHFASLCMEVLHRPSLNGEAPTGLYQGHLPGV